MTEAKEMGIQAAKEGTLAMQECEQASRMLPWVAQAWLEEIGVI